MTNTDTTEQEPRARHIGTPDPSTDYDGCTTVRSTDDRYRELFAAATAVHDCTPFSLPLDVRTALQEDHRRAHIRLTGGSVTTVRTPRTSTPVVIQPTETTDGLVITCQGDCGETKPAKKFPTRSGNRPGREAICRTCRDARIAARKAGA